MEKIFAIGDIHGSYELLEKILQCWNSDEEQLVFLGDYIDRGPDSLRVIQKVMELSEEYDAVTLIGNHEQIFLNWLEKPDQISEFYFNLKVGGAATVQSLLSFDSTIESTSYTSKEMVDKIKEQHPKIVSFMKGLGHYYYWNPFVFVHAGIDATVENFKDTKKEDFLWIRDEFTSTPHKSKETVVFGHTPTIFLNEDRTSKVWLSPCKKKIGIDGGGAIYENGRLHGVVFTKGSDDVTVFSTSLNEEVYSYIIQL